MNALLTHTWTLLSQNWNLVLILFLQNFLIVLATGGRGFLGGNPMVVLILLYVQHVMLGGWIHQMKKILVDKEKATWDHFLEGLALYFWPMMTGCSMLIFAFMIFAMVTQMLAGLIYQAPDPTFLDQFVATFQKGDPKAFEAFQQKHAQEVDGLFQYAQIFILGGLGFGLFNILISFWQECCVFLNTTWIKAWQASYEIIVKNMRSFLYLGLVWLVPTALIKLGLFIPNPLIGMMAFALDLIATTYFTLLFCHYLVLVTRPPEEAPTEEVAS